MVGDYARAEGLPDAGAEAIRDHYKPVGQGDDVPTAPVTVAVALADKLDTLVHFFAVSELPTGSKDPFALRRAALAIIAIIVKNELSASLNHLAAHIYRDSIRTWIDDLDVLRSEEHTSELQSLMRISYAVFCLKKKKQ